MVWGRQFTLRAGAIFVVVLALLLAWISTNRSAAIQRRQLAMQMNIADRVTWQDLLWARDLSDAKRDFLVYRPGRYEDRHLKWISSLRPKRVVIFAPVVPDRLRPLLQADSIERLTIMCQFMDESCFASLSQGANVRDLNLTVSGLNDSDLRHIAKMKRLEFLSLKTEEIRGEGVVAILGLKNLSHAHIESRNLEMSNLFKLSAILRNKKLVLFLQTHSGGRDRNGIVLAHYPFTIDSEERLKKRRRSLTKYVLLHQLEYEYGFVTVIAESDPQKGIDVSSAVDFRSETSKRLYTD